MKRINLTYDRKTISNNPLGTYNKFQTKVITTIRRNQKINTDSFYSEFKAIAEELEQTNDSTLLTKISRNLIEFLVSKKQSDLAGIAYSVLIKANKDNPKQIEILATNALSIAIRGKDPVHTFARANDLNELYSKTEPGSDRHIKYLRIANRALLDVCNNYDTSVANRYKTVSRRLKPLENYEFMLCSLKLEIVEYTMAKEPHNAKYELEQVKMILEKNKNSNNVESIEILSRKIAEIEAKINTINKSN